MRMLRISPNLCRARRIEPLLAVAALREPHTATTSPPARIRSPRGDLPSPPTCECPGPRPRRSASLRSPPPRRPPYTVFSLPWELVSELLVNVVPGLTRGRTLRPRRPQGPAHRAASAPPPSWRRPGRTHGEGWRRRAWGCSGARLAGRADAAETGRVCLRRTRVVQGGHPNQCDQNPGRSRTSPSSNTTKSAILAGQQG